MIEYGLPPDHDEIEVSLFGPGYGEAIVVHLGDGAWLLVDSCIDPVTKVPATEIYLNSIGIGAHQVHTIVASHWHDDHVRGISTLAANYPEADFVISGVFNSREAATFLAAYSGGSSAGLARGAKELFDTLKTRNTVLPALHRSTILEKNLNGRLVRVTALSPTPDAYLQSIAHLAQYLPQKDKSINHAPELRPNHEAVVVHIDLDDDAILLGADLEDDKKLGWTAVVADKWSGARKPATAYKVAHHGSHTGDCPQIWATLLKANPIACLTPFTLGDQRLPTAEDKERVKGRTQHAYISSGASRRPEMDHQQLKRLGDICTKIAKVDAGFGAVRLRRKIGAPIWKVELFGAAQAL